MGYELQPFNQFHSNQLSVVNNRAGISLIGINMKRLDVGATVSCSLNGAEFHERRTLARRTLLPKVTAGRRIEDGLMLTLNGGPSLRSELETFVSLERQCCEFLKFTISEKVDESRSQIELRITGEPEAAATIEIFAQAMSDFV